MVVRTSVATDPPAVKTLALWVLILFLLPMAVDGTSHLISDFAGIGQGFRDSNAWLATFTIMLLRHFLRW